MEQYQSFGELPGASNSLAKLLLLGLPKLSGCSFLDVGCNEGFFVGFAYACGARRAIGLDVNNEYIQKARARFPSATFILSDWTSLFPSDNDVVLCASAIHYADDQIGLIRKMLYSLSKRGVLVLELGLVPPSSAYIKNMDNGWLRVKRPVGDYRSYTSLAYLEKTLSDYVIRDVGPSIVQSGDDIPRRVLHIRCREPICISLVGASGHGKSSLSNILCRCAEFISISFDQYFHDCFFNILPKSKEPPANMRSLFFIDGEFHANPILIRLLNAQLLEEFITYLLSIYEQKNATAYVLELGSDNLAVKDLILNLLSKRFIMHWLVERHGVYSIANDYLEYPEKYLLSIDNTTYFKSRKTFRFVIDRIESDVGMMYLHGWCADLENQDGSKTIFVGPGAKIPRHQSQVSQYIRPDLAAINATLALKSCGFTIVIDTTDLNLEIDGCRIFLEDFDSGWCFVTVPSHVFQVNSGGAQGQRAVEFRSQV